MAANPTDNNYAALCDAARMIIRAIGDDPTRDGLKGTPDRFARAWIEFAFPLPQRVDTTFVDVVSDQMAAVVGHRVWSMCEHHLLPFYCDLTMAYIPEGRILGLSKFARVANLHAAGLQVQERLVNSIARDLAQLTGHGDAPNPNVAISARGHHLCMEMRGVQSPAGFVTTALYGLFRSEPAVRAEFFALANGHKD